MGTWIRMRHGAPGAGFDAEELVAHIARSGRDYIIQGQVACRYDVHPKRQSLDVWLRAHTSRRDTKQGVNAVVTDLVATGLFRAVEGLVCPEKGTLCKGLQLTTKGKELASRLGVLAER